MARDTYLYGISIFLPVYAVLFKYLCSREAPETWSCSPLYLIHSNIVFGHFSPLHLFFLGLLPAFEEGELSEALLQPLPPRRQWRPAEAYLFDLLSFIIRKETTYENIPVIQLTTLYNIVQHDRTWQKLLENDSPYTVIHGIVQFDIPSLTWLCRITSTTQKYGKRRIPACLALFSSSFQLSSSNIYSHQKLIRPAGACNRIWWK